LVGAYSAIAGRLPFGNFGFHDLIYAGSVLAIAKLVGNQPATARANMSDVSRCLESSQTAEKKGSRYHVMPAEISGELTTNLGVRSSNLFGRAS